MNGERGQVRTPRGDTTSTSREAPPCAACQAGAEEVLLCGACLARTHPACRGERCPACGDEAPPLGPLRAGAGEPAVRVSLPPPPARRASGRVRWRRVGAAALLLAALGLALRPGERADQAPLITIARDVDLPDPAEGVVFYPQQGVVYLSSADEWLARASEARRQGDLPGALAALDRAVELDPTHAPALSQRAMVRYELGDLSGALADRELVVELLPHSARAWSALGCVRDIAGDPAGGFVAADRALQLDTRHAYAWQNRARARLHLGDLEGAAQDVEKALELDPRNGWAWHTRAAVRLAQDDLAGAEADLSQALRWAGNPEPSPGLDALAAEVAARRALASR